MPLLLRYDGSASSVHAAAMPGWLTIQNHRSLTRCRRHIPSLRKSIRHCKKTLPAPSAMITSSGYCRISFFPRADWRPAEAMFRSDSGVFAGSCALLEGWGRSSFPPCFFFALLFAGVSKRRPLFFPRPLAARQTANAKLSRQSSHAKALTPKLFRWAPPCIAIRCSERCTQKAAASSAKSRMCTHHRAL